ncbi:MAG TPA: hypothetical protein VHO68_16205, partial [Bacteroidales bacterium]|nr:hypothetical protein [Bacteroidales bacterium]
LWAFFNNTTRNMSEVTTSIHQATTTYRPNIVIWNILRKNISLPFESKMSRPFYHMDKPDAFAETFYCSDSYALGNIQMTIVDNPNQQMVWSLVTKGNNGPLCFSGGHPMRGSTSGHSPYTQTLQSKGSLIVLTAPTGRIMKADTMPPETPAGQTRANLWLLSAKDQGQNYEVNNRAKYASKPLHHVDLPKDTSRAETERFWVESKNSASTWFFFPRELKPVVLNGFVYFDAGNMLLAIIPLAEKGTIITPQSPSALRNSEAKNFFTNFGLVVFPGKVSGYVLETAEKKDFTSIQAFDQAIRQKTRLNFDPENLRVDYSSISNDKLIMKYNPTLLRCNAKINGIRQDFDNFTGGAVYESPYVKIKKGIMKVSDGKNSYTVDFRDDLPVYN